MKRNKLMDECRKLITSETKLDVDSYFKANELRHFYTNIISVNCKSVPLKDKYKAGTECALKNVQEILNIGTFFNYSCYLKEPEVISLDDTEEFWLEVKKHLEHFKNS